jgi:hypothetical protein
MQLIVADSPLMENPAFDPWHTSATFAGGVTIRTWNASFDHLYNVREKPFVAEYDAQIPSLIQGETD